MNRTLVYLLCKGKVKHEVTFGNFASSAALFKATSLVLAPMFAFSCASSSCWALAMNVKHKFSNVRAHVYFVSKDTIMLNSENLASSLSD